MRSRLAGLILAASLTLTAAGETPRNILFILVDDLGKEWISCYGAEDIETPHIDALAEGGMLFENAYSMPQCTPSRVTALTGQYPWRTGWVNHWDVPRWGVGYFDWRAYTTFAEVLRDAGYATAAAGKWQINDFRLEPEAMRKHGFDDWAMWTGYETGNPPSAERYWDPYINTPDGSKTYEGTFGADVFVDRLIAFMGDHRDDPMLLYYPMALTHTPFVTTPGAKDADGKLQKHKAMVRYTDAMVGRLVKALEDLGLRERTVIFFTTDNGTVGSITGTRNGKKVKGAKAEKTEPGVCAPFIVNAPGLVPAGARTGALTDFTDLFPTFLDIAGVPLPEDYTCDGTSQLPVLRGEKEAARDWILAMGHGAAILDQYGVRGQVDYAPRVLRDKRYKAWVHAPGEIRSLYDLEADPTEQINLIESTTPAVKEALNRLEAISWTMPEGDHRPRYQPRAANAWDKQAKDVIAGDTAIAEVKGKTITYGEVRLPKQSVDELTLGPAMDDWIRGMEIQAAYRIAEHRVLEEALETYEIVIPPERLEKAEQELIADIAQDGEDLQEMLSSQAEAIQEFLDLMTLWVNDHEAGEKLYEEAFTDQLSRESWELNKQQYPDKAALDAMKATMPPFDAESLREDLRTAASRKLRLELFEEKLKEGGELGEHPHLSSWRRKKAHEALTFLHPTFKDFEPGARSGYKRQREEPKLDKLFPES